MTRVVASIEARMGSTRLPGKVLADIQGEPALTRLLRRLRRCTSLDGIVLATSTSKQDDVLERWAKELDVEAYRGSEEDVLSRVVEAHEQMGSDVIVEICGDCTLMDPDVVDMAVDTFLENECDVVTNARKPSFPMGVEVQVFRTPALVEIEANVDDPVVREHVSPYFYQHPERYRTIHLMAPPRWRLPTARLHLDYPEDLDFINEVYRRLGPLHGDDFGVPEIVELLRREPGLTEINAHLEEQAG